MGDIVAYATPPAFQRVRKQVWLRALESGTLLAVCGGGIFFGSKIWHDSRMIVLLPFWFIWFGFMVWMLVGRVRELMRSAGAFELRIDNRSLAIATPDDQAGHVIELDQIEHVMVADYERGGTHLFLLLRDARCIEVPSELVFPHEPIVKAVLKAAPHATRVTNAQMPKRDPRHELTPWEPGVIRRRERDERRRRLKTP